MGVTSVMGGALSTWVSGWSAVGVAAAVSLSSAVTAS